MKPSPRQRWDAIVIGAGAAGMMCAAVAGQRGARVLLIDHAEALAEKIRISGGGRCNFTNLHTRPERFLSANPPAMGPRVAAANHVGPMLSLSQPRQLDTRPPLMAAVRKRSGIALPADDDDFRKFLEGVRAKFAPTL